ncbi:mechanosensitive ion channel family protein [Gynurincola endophyticus]|uniref:mechanosensitive ion channel family protein n=1 Tax=Gynurincola endophyticus TaxID=2479004 RepID=UPI000F8EB0EA|nr:mechanosensitive ion channel family protein [Gynurincola endophyticus]
MTNFWDIEFWNNSLSKWLFFICIILGASGLIKLLSKIFINDKNPEEVNTEVKFKGVIKVLFKNCIIPIAYTACLYYAFQALTVPEKLSNAINYGMLIAITFWVSYGLGAIVSYIVRKFVQAKYGIDTEARQSNGIIMVVKLIIWLGAFIFIIGNFGYDIRAIITGLGVGGVAIALAAQTILSDLFSYFGIFFDKPFAVGDFLIVDDKLGSVEHIGIRTTRLRSINGEQLVFSNSNLTNSRIHNYQKLERRRVLFRFKVDLSTPSDKLATIPDRLKQIVESQPDTSFDRAHLAAIGDYSYEFEIVFQSLSPEYMHFMDKKQAVKIEIVKLLEELDVKLAIPTYKILNHDQTKSFEEDEL